MPQLNCHKWLKVGFHYPSSRAELTARELGCFFDTRQRGPSTRVVETDLEGQTDTCKSMYLSQNARGLWSELLRGGALKLAPIFNSERMQHVWRGLCVNCTWSLQRSRRWSVCFQAAVRRQYKDRWRGRRLSRQTGNDHRRAGVDSNCTASD